MRPPEITNNAIIAAGKQILAEKRRVTGSALRKLTGGGNPARLMRVWDEHLRSKKVAKSGVSVELSIEAKQALSEMSRALTGQAQDFALQINAIAIRSAECRVGEALRAAKEGQAKAEESLAKALEEKTETEGQLGYVRATGIKARAELNKAIKELSVLRERAANAERELAISQEKLAREREARERAEVDLKKVSSQRDKLIDRISS